MFVTVFAALLLLGVPSYAQRPANASICDYYTIQRFGANSTDTQTQLIEGIVALAFGGGTNFTNGSATAITGILNPGTFDNTTVNLAPWFDGSLLSTNLNNQGVSINWLDDGARGPLYDYLNGLTPNPVFKNSSNEYRLFGHFNFVFGKLFGCTQGPPAPPATGAPLSLAYVHKFMNLNSTQLGHFIDQLTKATAYFGFSQQDSMTLNTRLNSQYNVRCAPAVSIGSGPPQLFSLCQAASCPLAVPVADCGPYVNLTADGKGPSSPTTIGTSGTVMPTATAYSSPPSAASPSTAASSSVSLLGPSSSSSTLSAGAIAGISIGGAAVLFIFIAVMFWIRRRRPAPAPMAGPPPQMMDQSYAHTPLSPYPQDKSLQHASYLSSGTHMAEMDSPRGGYQSPNSPHASYRYTYDPEHGNRVISTANVNQIPVELGHNGPRNAPAQSPPPHQPPG